MKRFVITACMTAMFILFFIGGCYTGYRYTILHQSIEFDGDTAFVTLFNRIDAYDLE